jgi:histidine triad (HIT) family protein
MSSRSCGARWKIRGLVILLTCSNLIPFLLSRKMPARTNNNHVREGFDNNKTVFGKILRGELPRHIVHETDDILVFDDISPASQNHWLLIPKKHISRPSALTPDDAPLLDNMVQTAKDLVAKYNTENAEVVMGFHRFPFLSVYHLHMHVIFPMPAKSWYYKMKFPKRHGPFFKSPEAIRKNYCTKR